MAIVTGDRYVQLLVKFVEKNAGALLEGNLILKLNPVGLHYVQSRLEALQELERLRAAAPVDYLRAYIADLGDHRALEQLRRVLRLLTALKVVSVLPHPSRDPTPLSLLPFGRLRSLELRGCDLSNSAARGLLELRHTLEKLVCHNSTDALRHIFAGRIVDIQDCPVWTRLSFVSCAGNNIVLMDESLQLLPVVETLDLSRNRFAKISNLRKCTKLKHLDLGFNHIRTVASLNEVAVGIRTLILRNNALTTLHGIENLISLEGLDLSYNMISSFAEIELLASLPSLENIWLEGNPISFARLYRQQVFSFFANPHKLKLDEIAITGREAWTVKVIVAKRHKQRAGYGFYAPAKCVIQSNVSSNSRNLGESSEANSFEDLHKAKRKSSRLAWIEDSENKRYLLSEGVEQDESYSPSCESESQRWDKTDISESARTSAVDLMNRIELLKREKSPACFQELTDLLDQTDEGHIWDIDYNFMNKKAHIKSERQPNNVGDCSKAISAGLECLIDHKEGAIQEAELQEVGNGTNNAHNIVNIKQENSLQENFSQKVKAVPELLSKNITLRSSWPSSETREVNCSEEGLKAVHDAVEKLPKDMISSLPGNIVDEEMNSIDEIIESRSSSYCYSSPPHYQKDILHRRQNLEEEFVHLSLDSYSLASSSDSETSDGVELYLSDSLSSLDGQTTTSVNIENDITGAESDIAVEHVKEENSRREECIFVKDPSLDAHGWPDSDAIADSKSDRALLSYRNEIVVGAGRGRVPHSEVKSISQTMKITAIRKQKKRVVLLDSDGVLDGKYEQIINSYNSFCGNSCSIRNGMKQSLSIENGFDNSEGNKQLVINSLDKGKDLYANCVENSDCNSDPINATFKDPIEFHFKHQVADGRLLESCIFCVYCSCIRLWEDDPEEREVVLLLSSESRLYILLASSQLNQPGIKLKVLGSHNAQDISHILVGIGLQAVRVRFGYDATYLFLMRNIAKSRDLLDILEKCHLSTACERFDFSLESWELMQIKLFEKNALGGVRLNIILYAMLLFKTGSAWFARSLFLTGGHIFLCVEDLIQFGTVSEANLVSEPYFLLEAWSSISSILEVVVEAKQCGSVILVFSDIMHGKFQVATSERVSVANYNNDAYKDDLGHIIWRLKGFAEDTLLKFITLLKAVYMEATMHPLSVKNVMQQYDV